MLVPDLQLLQSKERRVCTATVRANIELSSGKRAGGHAFIFKPALSC